MSDDGFWLIAAIVAAIVGLVGIVTEVAAVALLGCFAAVACMGIFRRLGNRPTRTSPSRPTPFVSSPKALSTGMRTTLMLRLIGDLRAIEMARRLDDVDLDAMPNGPVLDYSVRQGTKSVIWMRDRGRCTTCGSFQSVSIVKFKSGTATYDNLRVACRECAES